MLVFFFLKKFAFDVVKINSLDMEGSYGLEDAVLVKKFSNSYSSGDFIYFEYPIADSLGTHTYFTQRIIGIPGDSVLIEGKQVLVNGRFLAAVSDLKFNYFIKSKQILFDSAFLARYHLVEGGRVSDSFDYSYALTTAQADSLSKDSLVNSVQMKMEKKDAYDETCFPGSPHFKWNMDFFGPVYVPRKNDTLPLDSISIKLYANLITESEKNKLEIKHDSILINGTATRFYVIKKNYFFVLGDNRDNANDSRIWGLLPDNLVIGKVVSTVRKAK